MALLRLVTLDSDVKESEIDEILRNSFQGLERWLGGSKNILHLKRSRVDQS